MNNLLFVLSALLALSTAHASNQPGFLSEFNYQVTNLSSMEEAQRLMDIFDTRTTRTSVCANRAHFWAYDIFTKRNIQTGKVFIHFTPKGQADENGKWAYHVAPYVLVNGEETVLDAGFGYFKGAPTSLKKWSKYFGKDENCIVLDPINNPKHLKLEQYNMPNDWTLPKDWTSGGARQYPTPPNSTCYIRKVPMYYAYPVDVYGVDLYLNKVAGHERFFINQFNTGVVLSACNQAVKPGFKIEHSCKKYFGF